MELWNNAPQSLGAWRWQKDYSFVQDRANRWNCFAIFKYCPVCKVAYIDEFSFAFQYDLCDDCNADLVEEMVPPRVIK